MPMSNHVGNFVIIMILFIISAIIVLGQQYFAKMLKKWKEKNY
jgi:hypothetical protein